MEGIPFIYRDKKPPILTANSVREALGPQAGLTEIWQECLAQLNKTIPEILKDKKAFAEKTSDATRVTPTRNKVRKQATGMMFHRSDPSLISSHHYV